MNTAWCACYSPVTQTRSEVKHIPAPPSRPRLDSRPVPRLPGLKSRAGQGTVRWANVPKEIISIPRMANESPKRLLQHLCISVSHTCAKTTEQIPEHCCPRQERPEIAFPPTFLLPKLLALPALPALACKRAYVRAGLCSLRVAAVGRCIFLPTAISRDSGHCIPPSQAAHFWALGGRRHQCCVV